MMLAVKECDEQVYFLILVNNSTVFKEKKKEYTFGNIIRENNL